MLIKVLLNALGKAISPGRPTPRSRRSVSRMLTKQMTTEVEKDIEVDAR